MSDHEMPAVGAGFNPNLAPNRSWKTIRFLKTVRIGDEVEVRLEIIELLPETRRARLATRWLDQHGVEVLSGVAGVIPPP